jgi:hypothetical protein
MGAAIGQILPEAIGVAISPIIAVVLMLATPKGEGNGLAFLVGWLIGLGLVGVIVPRPSRTTSLAGDQQRHDHGGADGRDRGQAGRQWDAGGIRLMSTKGDTNG